MQGSIDYWKQRCELAERALRLARVAITQTEISKALLQALADLRPGEALDTNDLASRSNFPPGAVYQVLRRLEGYGLVDRVTPGARGHGNAATWRLGFLVTVSDE